MEVPKRLMSKHSQEDKQPPAEIKSAHRRSQLNVS